MIRTIYRPLQMVCLYFVRNHWNSEKSITLWIYYVFMKSFQLVISIILVVLASIYRMILTGTFKVIDHGFVYQLRTLNIFCIYLRYIHPVHSCIFNLHKCIKIRNSVIVMWCSLNNIFWERKPGGTFCGCGKRSILDTSNNRCKDKRSMGIYAV